MLYVPGQPVVRPVVLLQSHYDITVWNSLLDTKGLRFAPVVVPATRFAGCAHDTPQSIARSFQFHQIVKQQEPGFPARPSREGD